MFVDSGTFIGQIKINTIVKRIKSRTIVAILKPASWLVEKKAKKEFYYAVVDCKEKGCALDSTHCLATDHREGGECCKLLDDFLIDLLRQ